MEVACQESRDPTREFGESADLSADEGLEDCSSSSTSGADDCSEDDNAQLRFKCDFPGCDAAFRKACRLQWHIRVHDGERPYECDFPECEKQYTRSYHLTRHKKKTHEQEGTSTGSSGYPCSLDGCKKVLSTRQLLKRHVDNYHKNRQFVCATCGKRFQKHRHLRSHEFEHNRVFPFVCSKESCGKGFLTRAKLSRHFKGHDGYVCDIENCGEKFDKWSTLRKHKSVAHRKIFQCQRCSKTFSRRSLLEDHVGTHDEEREAFECSKCHGVLLSTKSLKAHQIRCGAVKEQMVCAFPACGKLFLRKANFLRHQSLHSSSVPDGV